MYIVHAAQYLLQLEFISIKISKCDCLQHFTIVTKFFSLTFSFPQPQIVLNLFLFFRRFEPHRSYLKFLLIKKECIRASPYHYICHRQKISRQYF